MNSKSGRASFLAGSLSTCDKKLPPTDFKNFQDFLITVVWCSWLILIEIFYEGKGYKFIGLPWIALRIIHQWLCAGWGISCRRPLQQLLFFHTPNPLSGALNHIITNCKAVQSNPCSQTEQFLHLACSAFCSWTAYSPPSQCSSYETHPTNNIIALGTDQSILFRKHSDSALRYF